MNYNVALHWESPGDYPTDAVTRAKVGKGWLILRQPSERGTGYVSSFGPNSERSFSGFLPGKDLEEAKLVVLDDATKYWR